MLIAISQRSLNPPRRKSRAQDRGGDATGRDGKHMQNLGYADDVRDITSTAPDERARASRTPPLRTKAPLTLARSRVQLVA